MPPDPPNLQHFKSYLLDPPLTQRNIWCKPVFKNINDKIVKAWALDRELTHSHVLNGGSCMSSDLGTKAKTIKCALIDPIIFTFIAVT